LLVDNSEKDIDIGSYSKQFVLGRYTGSSSATWTSQKDTFGLSGSLQSSMSLRAYSKAWLPPGRCEVALAKWNSVAAKPLASLTNCIGKSTPRSRVFLVEPTSRSRDGCSGGMLRCCSSRLDALNLRRRRVGRTASAFDSPVVYFFWWFRCASASSSVLVDAVGVRLFLQHVQWLAAVLVLDVGGLRARRLLVYAVSG
jgi:hypothetical protein